jgi:hypothetical protein
MNLSMVISVYASISRELGLPLRFPGTPNAYTALYQVTSADILARATEWATTSPSCQTQSYLRIGQRYLRMTQNPLSLHVVCCRIGGAAPQDNWRIATPMAASLKLLPGSTVRWRGRRYLIVNYESLDAIIARQPGKRRLERIPVSINTLSSAKNRMPRFWPKTEAICGMIATSCLLPASSFS